MREEWIPVLDGDLRAYGLYRRHYSARRYRMQRQRLFVGPGEKMVLLLFPGSDALFVWRKFIDGRGERGVNCAVFRNESAVRSSSLIEQAMALAWKRWPGERLYTYVNPKAIRSTNPGYCFKRAGCAAAGRRTRGSSCWRRRHDPEAATGDADGVLPNRLRPAPEVGARPRVDGPLRGARPARVEAIRDVGGRLRRRARPHYRGEGEAMARARLLKPSFFANEDLPEIDPMGRLLFMGLWCLADRAGRLEDRPRRIKGELFPYENPDVDALLDDLARLGFIERYTVNGERFIQVSTFAKHQTPHVREPESRIPAPGEHSASTVQEQGKHQAGHAEAEADPVTDPVAEAEPEREAGTGTREALSSSSSDRELSEVDLAVGRLCREWERATGTTVTPMLADALGGHLDDGVPEDWLADAIRETGAQGKKAWRYTAAILANWKAEGRRREAPAADDDGQRLRAAYEQNLYWTALADHVRTHGCGHGCAQLTVGTFEQWREQQQQAKVAVG